MMEPFISQLTRDSLRIRKPVELEINEILALGLKLQAEAVLITEVRPGLEKVVFVNRAFEQLSGYPAEALAQAGLALLEGQETDRSTLQRLLNPASETENGPLEILLYKKDGTPFWDRIKIARMVVGDQAFHVQTHSDVTIPREIRNRFILAQKREATSHLVSGLAHDFNNLLTAILVYSGLMATKVKGDEQLQRYVAEVHHSAERGGQLVSQLLNLGRDEATDPELVKLEALVAENCDLLKRVLGEDRHLNVQVSPGLWKTRVHPGRIQQILLNLAINARDAMPGGGELLIQLANQEAPAASKNYVQIVVRDSGTGMDEETMASIFKPFFSTKGKGKGTGLGLFVIRTIVQQYEGEIHVESKPGKGTAFTILLPAA